MAVPRVSCAAVAALILCSSAMLIGMAAAWEKLPADFKRCTKAEAAREGGDCLRVAIADALPRLRDGLPRLGLPPMDPLLIDELRIRQGAGPVSMDFTFTGFRTEGLSRSDVVSARADLGEQMKFYVVNKVSSAVATSKYTVKGRVLMLPISGSGDSRIVLRNVTAKWEIHGVRTERKNGRTYMNVTDVLFSMTPAKMTMQLDNLFNGDPNLGKAMNRVLNDNWQLVWNELGSSFNDAYAQVGKEFSRALLQRVPLDEVFPDEL